LYIPYINITQLNAYSICFTTIDKTQALISLVNFILYLIRFFLILLTCASTICGLRNDRIPMTAHYAEIFAAVLKVLPAQILYPNGNVKKLVKFLNMKSGVKSFFKKNALG
jgi:hypothetical protein